MSEDRMAYRGPKVPERVGKAAPARLINKTQTNTGGFKCDTCDASFTSYDAYLDHTNSRIHLKNIGVGASERVDDPARIRARLAYLREKKKNHETMKTRIDREPIKVIEERLAQKKLEEELKRKEKYQRKKEKPKEEMNKGETDEDTALMASVLGISSFK